MQLIIYKDDLKAGLYQVGPFTYYHEGPEEDNGVTLKLPAGDDVTRVAYHVVQSALAEAKRDELGWDAPKCKSRRNIVTLLRFNHDLELGNLKDEQSSFLYFQSKQAHQLMAASIETPFRRSLGTPLSARFDSEETSEEEETSDEESSPVAASHTVEQTEETELDDSQAKKFISILTQKRPPQTPISSKQTGDAPTTKQLFETVAAITKINVKSLIDDTIKKIRGSDYLKGLVIRNIGEVEEHLAEIHRGKGSYVGLLTLSILLKRPIMIRAESELLEVNMKKYPTHPLPLLYTGDGGYDHWDLAKEFELDSLLDKNGIDMLDENKLQL